MVGAYETMELWRAAFTFFVCLALPVTIRPLAPSILTENYFFFKCAIPGLFFVLPIFDLFK